MPEEQPLEQLALLQWVTETQFRLFIIVVQQIQQDGAGLMHGECPARRILLRCIKQDGDPAIGIETQEPILLLLVGHDIDKGGAPCEILGWVEASELFKGYLDFLAIGSGLSDQVETLVRSSL